MIPDDDLPASALYHSAGHDALLTKLREWLATPEVLALGPSANEAADVHGLTLRVFQRRLEELDTSYSAEIEAARRAAAEQHLRAGKRVDTTAGLVGYADVGSFHRAWKRWTGTSPGRWAREHRQKDETT